MEIGFTGTQEGMTKFQKLRLISFLDHIQMNLFAHGDCVGADAEAHEIIRTHNQSALIRIHGPDIENKRAFCDGDIYWPLKPYLERNKDIVTFTAHLIAAPKGPEEQRSGTWSTIRWAKRIGRPVTILWPDGTLENVVQPDHP